MTTIADIISELQRLPQHAEAKFMVEFNDGRKVKCEYGRIRHAPTIAVELDSNSDGYGDWSDDD